MRYIALLTLLPGLWAAADKKLPLEQNSNEIVEISATLLDKDEVVKELGSDFGGSVIVMRVGVRPLTEKPLRIDLDDFFLLSTKDGQRCAPFAPSQIAGAGALIVSPQGVRGGGMMGQPAGPVWGGYPGSSGQPSRLPGNGGAMGNTPTETANEVSVKPEDKTDSKPKENPLLKTLKAKVLPEKETTENVSGLLYFEIEGKVKPKDLELHYKTPAGRLAMRFKP
jgi:hypothetical protein